MKKILVLCLFVSIISGAFARANAVSEKVLKAFKETFTTAQEVNWHESGESYSVRFLQEGVRYIVYYSKDGTITNSMRFYAPSLLPMNILTEIKNHYSKKTAFGVTEITSGDEVAYFVRMEDAKNWYTIKFNSAGEGTVYEKLKKQQ